MFLDEHGRLTVPLFLYRPVTGRLAAAVFDLLVNPLAILYTNNLHCFN
jgi:hypothetical protein